MHEETAVFPTIPYTKQITIWVIVILLLLLGGLLFWQHQFSTSNNNPHIVFLSWDKNEQTQLFLTNLDPVEPIQLTQAAGDVISYAISPTTHQIAYTIEFEAGGSELWLLEINGRFRPNTPKRILSCPQARCSNPVWAADGRRLIYEKRELENLPILWWLDVETGETITVLINSNQPTYGAQLSPDGNWISYVNPTEESITLYNFENGRFQHIPTQMNLPAIWHPNNTQLIVTNWNLITNHSEDTDNHQTHTHDYLEAINLFIVNIANEEHIPLTNEGNVDDGIPVWSPDSSRIAFGRKLHQTNSGRQIWLTNPDGSDAFALTNNLMVHHGAIGWSGDGRYLLHQRFNTTTPGTSPSIWIIDLQTEQSQQIAPVGFLPTWLPP
ncbi:MAG: hypothetical protein GY943_17905 [Chloroflexi bacterium]|nr:hypothetical protein [Chloroflexota bacterium]